MVGGEKSGRRDTSNPTNYGTPPSGDVGGEDDEFGRRVARIAAVQICESVGFHSARTSALDALADLAIRFLHDLGRAASSRAVVSGRTSSNELDIIQGIEDLGFGDDDRQHCLVGSGVVRGIKRFVETVEEAPFACPIPRFPVRASVRKAPSFAQIGEEPPKKHIPDWLPAFPDPHTYVFTPMWNERSGNPRMDKLEQARQRRKAERSLLSLQKRILHNVPSRFDTDRDDSGEGDGKQLVDANEVGKRLTAVDAFRPVIEAARNGAGFECRDGERGVLSKRRLGGGHLKFGVHKRPLAALPSSFGGTGVKNNSWFLRDDEKDDKKRRAELILKESMENPQELMQL